MARITLGIGTSHSPLLAINTETWPERAADDRRKLELFLGDGRVVSFDELNAEAGGQYAKEATADNFTKQAEMAQNALDALARAIQAAELDVIIVIGDDQGELFSRTTMPAFAVYTGEEIITHPKNEVDPDLPSWNREANLGYRMDTVHHYPAAPEMARALVDGLIARGVEVSIASEVLDPHEAGFGHAYGFVMDRLVGEREIPMLPVLLNTYFPPNVPRPARCYEIGTMIAEVVESLPGDQRVGVIASGGLSHFAVDEPLDRTVLRALAEHDGDTLSQLPYLGLRSGNSEILNWIMTGGAARGLEVTVSEYIPVRRTEAGTGVGLGFLVWEPAAEAEAS